MDELYKAVLGSYCWDDPVFANGFNLVMGTILAAKTPLSSSALHSLHRLSSVPIDKILHQINSFTTSWSTDNPSQLIQIMRQSLRESTSPREPRPPPKRRDISCPKNNGTRNSRYCA
ncbi:hypothetical protein FS749_008284 [Ceratobasidium sp. UAMH 11750]|nr:hypothetical protein FS749_008284 [Ceratobasidium sp. UAMH 11750]